MNFVITPVQGDDALTAAIKPKNDVAYFLDKIGFIPLYFSRFVKLNTHWQQEVLGALAAIHSGDVAIFQTPTYAGQDVEDFILDTLRARNVSVIAFVHDIDYLRFPSAETQARTVWFYNQCACVILSDAAQQDRLHADGVKAPIVLAGPFGYVQSRPISGAKYSHTVHYAGNLTQRKAGFLADVPDGLAINVYGRNESSDGGVTMRPGVNYCGPKQQAELADALTNGFGLIWDADISGSVDHYAMVNMPHKFSLYMSLGLPVIAPAGSAVGDYIQRNRVGLTVKNLADMRIIVDGITPARYQAMVVRTVKMGVAICNGYHTQVAAITAVMLARGAGPV